MSATTQAWTLRSDSVVDHPGTSAIDVKSWNDLNLYVYTGVKLPDGMPEPPLKDAYALIREHTREWRDVTFPQALTVADDVVDYASRAPRLYSALSRVGDELDTAPDGSQQYETSKWQFVAVLNQMISDTDLHGTKANHVSELVRAFRTATTGDHAEVTRLRAKYRGEYGEGSAQLTAVTKELEVLSLMGAAEEALGNIARAWTVIAAELETLNRRAAGMKGTFGLYFVDIDEAVARWKLTGETADAWRKNAFSQFLDAAT